jgi:hypothetical protein
MELIKTGRQIGRTLKNAARLRTIVGVFAKHGFANIAEKIKLGRFTLDRLNAREDIEKFTAKVEKQADGIFKYKGYVKDGAKKDSAAQEEVKEKAKNLDF